MIISIVNHANLLDEEVQRATRAINRQIHEDYAPYWSLDATLRLEGKVGLKPKPMSPDLRGDAVIYLWDKADVEGALGYHAANYDGLPYGFVFTEISKQLNEPWTVTLSHEALELLGDSETNLLVQGPHPDPKEKGRTVFFWYEMSDAVQAETYTMDGVEVSNFVLPLYFTTGNEPGSRNDFLGRQHDGRTLTSFGVNPGGYVGFFDPKLGKHTTYFAHGDNEAKHRMTIKDKLHFGRRGGRYQQAAGNRFAKALAKVSMK